MASNTRATELSGPPPRIIFIDTGGMLMMGLSPKNGRSTGGLSRCPKNGWTPHVFFPMVKPPLDVLVNGVKPKKCSTRMGKPCQQRSRSRQGLRCVTWPPWLTVACPTRKTEHVQVMAYDFNIKFGHQRHRCHPVWHVSFIASPVLTSCLEPFSSFIALHFRVNSMAMGA